MHDPAAGDEQQDRFRQRGKVFDLAVAIGMGFIRGAGRDADGEEGDARGYKVKAAVQGFGKDIPDRCTVQRCSRAHRQQTCVAWRFAAH